MDVTVSEAHGLPEKAYLSIRAGEVRKQVQFRRGECFHFDLKSAPRHLMVDVFEKVGSTQVSLSDLPEVPATGEVHRDVDFQSKRGDPMKLVMKMKLEGGSEETMRDDKQQKRQARHQAALEAKAYLDGHAVQKLLQSMIHELLATQPNDAVGFMCGYLGQYAAQGETPANADAEPAPVPEAEKAGATGADGDASSDMSLPDWSAQPGLGDDEMPGFSADGSEPLPDLEDHHSVLAKVLREDHSLYARLRDERTPGGVSLAKCIKTGVDNRGHAMVRTMGLVAGDEDCYDVFRDVFEPVVSRWHGGYEPDAEHPSDLELQGVSALPIDPHGGYAVAVQVRGGRNLSGLPMLPSVSREERREVERLLSQALLGLQGDLRGEYHPLRGSGSFQDMPGGMPEDVESQLQARHLLFEQPDSRPVLSGGFGRHWPDARGVFVGDAGDLAAWVNESDHIKVIACRPDQDLRAAFARFSEATEALALSLQAAGREFAASRHFGFLSACPSSLGTGMHVVVTLCIPQLGRQPRFTSFARWLGLSVCLCMRDLRTSQDVAMAQGRFWDVSIGPCLGCSEVSQVNLLIEGCRQLVDTEWRLQSGDFVDLPQFASVPHSPVASARRGLRGSGTFEGIPDDDSVMSDDECPEELPDLAKKCMLAADVFRENPSVYSRLKDLKTPGGVSLGRCIKVLLELDGHPLIKTVGAVAGDEACYETFRELFDPLIALRHPGFKPQGKHCPVLYHTNVSEKPMDSGDRVLEVRLRMSRNLRGFPMLPACPRDERRGVEACLLGALQKVQGLPGGEYFPLVGSSSHGPRPGGMSPEEEARLRREGWLVEEPDSVVSLLSGYGRGWPDARGIYADKMQDAVAVVNEADHLQLAVRKRGSDMRGAFARLSQLHRDLERWLKEAGHEFAQSDRLGFLGSCPSRLGTCLTAAAVVRIPLLSALPDFKAICRDMKLQVHRQEGSQEAWEVSNLERLGSHEVDQVNAVMEGCRVLVAWESALDRGEEVVLEPGALPLPLKMADASPADFSDTPGLGDDEYPGFPADDAPDEMPDLSQHCSIATDVLKQDPSIYAKLKHLKTTDGVSFARCIKTGMDNLGHPMIKPVGAVAGDAECYDLFRAFFDPVISARHCGYGGDAVHPTDLDFEKVSSLAVDPRGEHVVSVRICVGRNILGFPMPPAISREERNFVEDLLVMGLSELGGQGRQLLGTYLPLRGSASYSDRPGGMCLVEEAQLTEEGLLLQEPDANIALAVGTGRHWPEGRGVFVEHSRELAAWVNEEDHLKFIATKAGADIKAAFQLVCEAEASMRNNMERRLRSFAKTDRLGFLSSCPSNLGTNLCAQALVHLPLIGAQPDFRRLCKHLRLQVRSAAEQGEGFWTVSNLERLGSSEVEQVNAVILGVHQLVDLEMKLGAGEKVDLGAISSPGSSPKAAAAPGQDASSPKAVLAAPGSQPTTVPGAASEAKAGEKKEGSTAICTRAQQTLGKGTLDGSEAKAGKKKDGSKAICTRAQQTLEKGTLDGRLLSILQSMAAKRESAEEDEEDEEDLGFPTDECPKEMPDLSAHHSLMADVLRRDPGIYARLRGSRTPAGTCLARCIKPGVDNRGHPMIRSVGAVAGDADCYAVFEALFGQIVRARHSDYSPAAGQAHPAELDAGKVSVEPIDASGKHVLSARVQASRNIRGAAFPTAVSREERREVERLAARALSALQGDLRGEYLPLTSSGSHAPRPGGIAEADREDLERHGLYPHEPDSAQLLSSGLARHWPDARGVFANPARSLAVQVNEEDHLRFVSTQQGDGLREAFARLCEAEAAVRASLRAEGGDYARSESLGFLTSCPSKLGSGGLKASALLSLPLLGSSPELRAECRRLGVQALPAGTPEGAWSVSLTGRLGHPDTELLAQLASACRRLVEMEVELERRGAAATLNG